jgi:hypothetical protein
MLDGAMYLDATEEKMLRAIVYSAIVAAAAGRSFAGEFHRYRINATRMRVNDKGMAEVEARVVCGVGSVVQICWRLVLAARAESTQVD